MNEKNTVADVTKTENPSANDAVDRGSTRRKFLGQIGAALAGGAVLGKAAIASAKSDNPAFSGVFVAPLRSDNQRVAQARQLRIAAAVDEGQVDVPPHTTNGDEQRYHDKSGTYGKGLLQDGIGLVNLAAFQSLRHAIDSGKFQDFENVIIGGTRTQNGPLGGGAFSMEGTDAVQFGNAPCPDNQINQIVVPPAPAVANAAYGTELIEMYWASLLRDVAFTDYASNPTAAQAAAELTAQPTYAGPRDGMGHVTPDLLFRGPYPGETVGPYVSQLHLIPTYFGTQPISQQLVTYLANVDYMNDATTYQQVQNGINTGLQNQVDPQLRYLHNGRDLGAYTHLDVLFQAYFTAFLVLNTIGAPRNPGNPYVGSTKQNGFGTFGGPDVAASLTAVARLALNSVWYQKWSVHLRHRPDLAVPLSTNSDRPRGNYPRSPKLECSQFPSRAKQLQQIRRLLPFAGFPRGLAPSPGVSYGTWHSGRCFHYHPEILLRRQFRYPESGRPD